MGWIIFICYLIYGLFINIMFMNKRAAGDSLQQAISSGADSKEIEKLRKWCKRASLIVDGMMWIGIISLAIFLLYGLGWVWYYFCSGFLIFEDQPFWDKVICGLISLIPLGFLIGFIMICFGWDPDRR